MSSIKHWFPIIIVIAIIVFLTMQSSEATLNVSDTIEEYCQTIFPNSYDALALDKHLFRSMLHLPLYFTLGCVVCLGIRNVFASTAICSLVALADEVLKIYLPTREFELRDIFIDVAGFIVGIIFVYVSRLIISSLKKERLN